MVSKGFHLMREDSPRCCFGGFKTPIIYVFSGPPPQTSQQLNNYLGMDLDYSEEGVVKISMLQYVQNILDSVPEEIRWSSKTPAAEHPFQVRVMDEKKSKVLPK